MCPKEVFCFGHGEWTSGQTLQEVRHPLGQDALLQKKTGNC